MKFSLNLWPTCQPSRPCSSHTLREMFDPFHRLHGLRSLLLDKDHDIDIVKGCLLPLDDIDDRCLHSILIPKTGSWPVRIRRRSPIVPCGCESPVFANHKITVMKHSGLTAKRIVEPLILA